MGEEGGKKAHVCGSDFLSGQGVKGAGRTDTSSFVRGRRRARRLMPARCGRRILLALVSRLVGLLGKRLLLPASDGRESVGEAMLLS